MGLGTNNVTITTAATFIPEIWSDEIVAAYKKSLVAANLIKKMSFKGKKGDTVHIPAPTRGSASAKAASTQVNLIAATEGERVININQHWEYSRLIEDIVEAQALNSMRQFYTGDAGYALSKKVEDDIFDLGKSANGGNGSTWAKAQEMAADGTLSDYTGTTQAFNDAGFRNLVQHLDDLDVPMDGRCLVVPPSVRNQIMGITRYTSSDFVNGQTVVNGQIGNLYGVDVYVSNNCPTTFDSGKGAYLFHKDAMVLAEQQGVRSQTQYKQDFLATLYTADTLYGTAVLRPDAAFNIAVNG